LVEANCKVKLVDRDFTAVAERTLDSIPDGPLAIDIADIEAPPETSIGVFDCVQLIAESDSGFDYGLRTKWDAIVLNHASAV
jgi:fatty-acyl-CoA synthase